MPRIEPLFRDYALSHQDRRNVVCHYFGITLIMFSVLAAAVFVPWGVETRWARIDAVWGVVALAGAIYLAFDLALGAGALVALAGLGALAHALPAHWAIPAAAFAVGWVFQLIGHKFEGKKPAFTRNAIHLLVGPLWILSHLHEALGLRRRAAAPLAVLIALALPLGGARAQDDETKLTPLTQQAADLQTKADDALKAKKHEDAIATYQKLIEHVDANKTKFTDFPESQQKAVRAHAYYNMACAYALTGKREAALDAVKNAIDAGFYDWQWLEKDEDLASVRGEPRWKELVQSLRGLDKEAKRIEKLVKETIKEKALFEFDFSVTTLDAEKVKLADLKGKTVVLTCFGTWNQRCKDFAPALVQLAQASKERGDPVQLVILDWERADPTDAIEADVKDFVRESKIAFPVAMMKEKDPTLDRIPDLRAFPTTIFIDKTGKVRARWDDEKLLSYEELEAMTKALVHEEPKKADEKKPDEKKKPDKKKPDKKDEEPF